MTERNTLNLSERMKVTACLNPIYTILYNYDIKLGYEFFSYGMNGL